MSAVIALATPRRIKASHRRRRRVASDHLLYIFNNPLSGTDPTGYKSVQEQHNGSICNTGQCRGTIIMPTGKKEEKIGMEKAGSAASANASSAASGASNQGANGVDGRKNEAAPTSDKGAVMNNDPVCPTPPANPGVSRAEATKDPSSIAALAIAANHVVDTMTSNQGESREDFDNRVGVRMNELTGEDGNEYRGAFHSRPQVGSDGSEWTQFGYKIQTSNSPLVSVAAVGFKADDKWVYDNSQDMHTHGVVKLGYSFTALDEAYSRGSSLPVKAGSRASIDHRGMSDRYGFSPTDITNGHSRLVRPNSIFRLGFDKNCKLIPIREQKLK